MTDDPEVIELNIRHYQHLLTLHSTEYTRDQVLRLLAEAQARLPAATSKAMDRER
jgi:hypothetical protein